MKLNKVLGILALRLSLSAQATLYQNQFNSGFANSGNIPDGNLSGWSDFRNLTGAGMASQITGVTVTLNISGGYNGDLYAYLSFGNVLVPLLNRVGVGTTHGGDPFGYSDSGMSVTFSDVGAGNQGDIHWYGGSVAPSGLWQPDGRAISPLSSATSFDAAGAVSFAAYQNMNPNGVWTLFIADVSGGGGTSHLNSWELDITAVPEPVNCALAVLGAVAGAGGVWRSQRVRGWLKRA